MNSFRIAEDIALVFDASGDPVVKAGRVRTGEVETPVARWLEDEPADAERYRWVNSWREAHAPWADLLHELIKTFVQRAACDWREEVPVFLRVSRARMLLDRFRGLPAFDNREMIRPHRVL